MAAQLDRLVANVIRSAERNQHTDLDLLHAFAKRGDASAFETLVRRHGPAVLATCRRVLPGADADDAFQAAFLALARHAPRVRAAVGGWLIAVAHRAAVRMKASAQRRAAVEAKHGGPGDESRDPSWREACVVLHQELDALPDAYRRPLVLCYLAGLTRDEAARELGVTVDAVKGRLERGRLRLRNRLARRGISLSIGLMTAAVGESAAAVPAHLIRAATAEPSPAVATLARVAVATPALSLRGAGMGLAAAIVFAGFALGLPGAALRDDKAKKEMPAPKAAKRDAKPADAADLLPRTVTGKVVDPDGKPVVGAEIIHAPIEGQPTVEAKSGDDGSFKVSVPLKSPGAWLFARAPGFVSNYLMPATNTPANVTFKLAKDVPIRGRVVGTEGKPVVGATVSVIEIKGTDEESLDGFLAGWLKRDPSDQQIPARGQVRWDEALRTLPDGRTFLSAKTDAEGRFEITSIAAERIVTLSVRGSGVAHHHARVITREGLDTAPYNRASREHERQDGENGLGFHPTFLPPAAEIVVETEKPIRGVVTALETGKPLAGVAVYLRRGERRMPEPSAVTDSAGRYEIHGARKADGYELTVKRNAEAGLLGRTVKVRDTAAFEPVIADIAMARGIVLTGRVIDSSTGESVPGYACVGVLHDNEFTAKRPEFATPDCYDYANTNKAGVFRTVVPPGPVLLMGGPHATDGTQDVYFKYQQLKPDPDYPDYFEPRASGFKSPGGGVTMMQGMYCKVLKLKPEQKELTVDVILKRATVFRVKVLDAAGKPVRKFVVAGSTSRDWMHADSHDGDSCVIYDLDAAKPRIVAFADPASDQVAAVMLKGDGKQPAEVKLAKPGTVRGKVVNPAGQPIAHVRVAISYHDRAVEEVERAWHTTGEFRTRHIETDAEGRFEFKGVVPGASFFIYGRRGAKYLQPPTQDRSAGFKAKSGESIDVGTIKLKED